MNKINKPSIVKRPKWHEVILPDFNTSIVLDIGCSTTKRNSSVNYYSLDIDKNFKPSICGDVCYLPLKNNSVNVVLLISTLEHIYDPKTAINEIHRVLQIGGKVYIQVPFIFFHHDKMDYFRFTKEGLCYMFKEFKEHKIELRYRGFFSTITSWLITTTFMFPDCIRKVFQFILWILINIFKIFDIGKERFYSEVFLECKK